MKNNKSASILVFFMAMFQLSVAQTNEAYEKLKISMWGSPEFKGTEIPDKWKGESAVVLAKSYEYEVKKEVFLNYVYENITLHKRIKLLDKSAINEFSQFSFENDYKNSAFWASYELKDVKIGIKVIKPSGKEIIIDIKDAVISEIKEGYNKKEYKKIAISDLEIGDILDYFYVIKNTYVEQFIKVMDPVFYLLVEEYPIVKQKFNVKILRKMYFNSKSINGAPVLKQTDSEDESSYSFVDDNREKADANLWAYKFRIYPTLKFQAFFLKQKALNALDFMEFFLNDKKSNNSNLDLAHIDNLVKKIYDTPNYADPYLLRDVKGYINSNFDKNAPSDSIIKYAYYYLRKSCSKLESNSLMITLSKVLEYKKIKHDLVITVPNYISDISDLILPREVSLLIRIKGKSTYFIGAFSPLSILKSISSEYQGNNAYAVSNPALENKCKVEKIVIPIDQPNANSSLMTIKVRFDENNTDSLIVNIDKSIIGFGREDEITSVLTEMKYNDEVESFLSKSESEKKKSDKKMKKEKDKIQKQEQAQKDCEEALKNDFKHEFKAGDNFKISSYTLKNMGIWDHSPSLQYDVNFKLGNLVKKMGSNYVVEIGRLITQQLELSKKDLERKVDIYAPYPRAYEYKIILEIPSSYKVKGLEKLNINIANSTGGFEGKAEIQGNNLVINAKKYYVHIFEKASVWPQMVEFIEAAYNYTQQNILLEKQ